MDVSIQQNNGRTQKDQLTGKLVWVWYFVNMNPLSVGTYTKYACDLVNKSRFNLVSLGQLDQARVHSISIH